MLSSKNESKQDARFAGKLDVLTERVDTLASTLATTASAIAKKDGEIAALRRDLEARDQTLQALVAHAREPREVGAADVPVDANELRALRNAVAGLTKEHAENAASAARVEHLAGAVRSLSQRIDELASNTPEAPVVQDPAVTQRVDALERELASTRASLERIAAEPDRPSEELLAMLGTLRTQVEALDGLRAGGVSEEQLDGRLAETGDAMQALAQRLDALAETVETAATGLGEKENELAELHRHFTESSTRIESVVEDIRDTLHALPEPSSASVDEVAARLERLETAARKANEVSARTAGELSDRIDVIDQRVATVAQEVSRAKTLWPVALRSLEARLDDAVHAQAPDHASTRDAPAGDEPAEDLLAGLRDSLYAMESVAAEMAKASETLAGPGDEVAVEVDEHFADEPAAEEASTDEAREAVESPAAAAAGSATIVPLRASEP